MVKDADGTERYETSCGMTFQDGSMEADLPMQQLSEMFNVNHFIISQANPHAVMFASFSLERSVWAHPLVGYVNGILLFIKNQVCECFVHEKESSVVVFLKLFLTSPSYLMKFIFDYS